MKNKILELLKKVNPNITGDEDLIQTGMITSFEVVNLILLLEEEMGIEIGFEDVTTENFRELSAICKMVDDKVKKNGK